MTDLVLQTLLGLSVFTIITILIWPKINLDWLANLCRVLVWSLPFERIPSVKTIIGNVRPSQVLVLIGVYFLIILFAKKDKELLQKKFNTVTNWIIAFFGFSLTSWFFIQDFKRFISTLIANLIVFLAMFLIANYAKNIYKLVKELILVLVVVAGFGIYQFLGDLYGLSPNLTGIILGKYSKEIFGIPRVHGTAFEPIYFAAILATGIVGIFVYFLSNKKVFERLPEFVNVIFLAILIVSFFLTVSKAGFLALPIATILLLVFVFKRLSYKKFIIEVGQLILGLASILAIIILYNQKAYNAALNFYNQAVATSTLDSASSQERVWFIEAGLIQLQRSPLFGIGSGQFGVLGNKILEYTAYGPTKAVDSFVITQNVYLEVWLEFGLIPFLIFLVILFWPIARFLYTSFGSKTWFVQEGKAKSVDPKIVAGLILSFSLIIFAIQWFFFSPLYFMPIFILLGLLWNLNSSTNSPKSDTPD